MTISFLPLLLPPSADPSKFKEFGREVKGVSPSDLTLEEFKEIEQALYKHDLLLFRNAELNPQQLYQLVKAFDPTSENYSHGNKVLENTKASVLNYIKCLPHTPQVQIIGHGTIYDHEGIHEITLKHLRHPEFHKTRVTEEDEANGYTRFYRWHIDAAMYDLNPPKVTALYGIKVPKGPSQTVRYDDGTGDELSVPLGTTAFFSGKTMFDILPKELKSLAVRARATYAPHPFQWIGRAKGVSTGLGLETENLEIPLDELPAWEGEKIKKYPFLWKNPVTGELHLQVHPTLINGIDINPVPQGKEVDDGVLYPQGGQITDLKEIRKLVYKMQRPGIAPNLVYPHPWEENNLVLFNNRGLMHSIVGVFGKDQVRLFHQCNLAASDEPSGPNEDDINKWA